MISTGWKLNIELDNHCVDTFVLDGQSNVVVSVCSNNSTQKCCDFSVSGLITLDNFYTTPYILSISSCKEIENNKIWQEGLHAKKHTTNQLIYLPEKNKLRKKME